MEDMNVLYLCVLRSPHLSNSLLIRELHTLDRLSHMMQHTDVNINFVALQLTYGLSTHAPLHEGLVSDNRILKNLQRLTFSPQMHLRYYCLLIWLQLVGPLSSPHVVSHLSRSGQLLNLVMLQLREEREIRLKMLVIQCIRYIVMPASRHHERVMLVDHFNLLFELFDLWKYYISYLTKYQKVHGDQVSEYVKQCIATVQAIYGVMLVLVQSPQRLGQRIKEQLKEQYDVDSFVEQTMAILRNWSSYHDLEESIRLSARDILGFTEEQGSEIK